jgi:hypothetical protein
MTQLYNFPKYSKLFIVALLKVCIKFYFVNSYNNLKCNLLYETTVNIVIIFNTKESKGDYWYRKLLL